MLKKRESNFELLRIIAMMAIVLGHFIGQGGGTKFPKLYIWGVILGSGARIAVSIFLMIGVWFMVDADLRVEQIIRLYFTSFFYSYVITLAMLITGKADSIKVCISCFFPLFRRTHWFLMVYICLLLLSPFLKKVFQWKREKLKLLLAILTILIPVMSTVTAFTDTWLDNIAYFIYCYFLIGYVKKYLWNNINIGFLWIFCALGLYLVMSVGTELIVGNDRMSSYALRLFSQYLRDFKCIPNLFIAFVIFMWFSKLQIGSVRWINYFGANTLGVYCIHQVPSFHDYLWKSILKCDVYWNTGYAFIYTIISTVGVFLIATFVDKIRIKYIEKRFVKSRLYKLINRKIETIYKECLVDTGE